MAPESDTSLVTSTDGVPTHPSLSLPPPPPPGDTESRFDSKNVVAFRARNEGLAHGRQPSEPP